MKANENEPGKAKRRAAAEFGVVTEAGTVRFERTLPGSIELVWSCLTESDRRAKWLASGPMDLRAGGQVELKFHGADLSHEKETPDAYKHCEQNAHHGRVTECDPPRRLSMLWNETSGDNSEVTFELIPEGRHVRLVVTHRRLADRAMLRSVSAGWHAHLHILEDYLTGRAPRGFWSTLTRLVEAYDKRIPAESAAVATAASGRE